MNFLSRIFTRTPSLRARVVVATAIGAAIPVLITCAVVWFGITNDRKERLDRRLDEAAPVTLALLYSPRGQGIRRLGGLELGDAGDVALCRPALHSLAGRPGRSGTRRPARGHAEDGIQRTHRCHPLG